MIVADANLVLFADQELAARIAPEADGYAVLWETTSSTYGWDAYHAGRLVRSVMRVDGETVEERGEPLPIEQGVDRDAFGPDVVAELFRRACGFSVDEAVDDPQFWLRDRSAAAPAAPSPPRRRGWRRRRA